MRFERRTALLLLLAGLCVAPSSPRSTPAKGEAPTNPRPPAATGTTKAVEADRPKRTLVTLRGEIVDYYCFIEKGARGPGHRDCGVRCVSGDVCMGLYTTDDRLFMISVNHLRAMEPLSFRGQPNPFDACRALIAERVDLTGYAMERKGQRIIEVMAVKAAP